jgi:hypothetical protein
MPRSAEALRGAGSAYPRPPVSAAGASLGSEKGVESAPMKSFLAACVAIVVIAVAGDVILNTVAQEPVSQAFATSAVRL